MTKRAWLGLLPAMALVASSPWAAPAFEFTEIGTMVNPALAPDGSQFVYNDRPADSQAIRFFDVETQMVSEPFDLGITPSSISFDGSDVVLSVGVAAIHRYSGGSISLLVDQTMEEPDPVDPVNTTFGGVLPGRRAVSDGRVVFHTVNGTKSAIWLADGAAIERLWSQYDVWCPASECGTKQTLRRIVDTSISGSRVAFATEAGVFISEIDGESCAILLENDIKDMSGCAIVVDTDFPDFTTRDWDTVILDGLDVVFQVAGEGVYFASGGGAPRPVVELGVTAIPGSAEVFTDVDAFFLEGGNVIFEGTGTFQCSGGAPFVGGGVFLWSRAGIETVLAPCDRLGQEFVSFAFLQANLPLSAESVGAQGIVLRAQVAPDLTLGPVRTATFLTGGTPVIDGFDAYPVQSDTVGVEEPESGENVKRILDEQDTPVAFATGSVDEEVALLRSTFSSLKATMKSNGIDMDFELAQGTPAAFWRQLLLLGTDGPSGLAPLLAGAATPFDPVGGPFGRFFETPQDLRGRKIRARVHKRPGDLPTEVRLFAFRDSGREGAVSPAFDLLEAPHDIEVDVRDLETLTLPEEPFVSFDLQSVEGIGVAFRVANAAPGTEVVAEVEQLALLPEPGPGVAGLSVLTALAACARSRRASCRVLPRPRAS